MGRDDWAQNTIPQIFAKHGIEPFTDIESVLDVACGLALRSQYIDAPIHVGVDIYPEYFKHIESRVPYVVLRQDVRNLVNFVDKSFDVVVALDIVEHLTKDEALMLISECERIAKKIVVIETPMGFIPQNLDVQGHGGHKYQTHRSGWEQEEFEALGYQVFIRPYKMSDVKRHTELSIPSDIKLIDAIKFV